MCGGGREACELTRGLVNELVATAAVLARAKRRLPPTDPLGAELHRIDEAFAEPIDLARKLGMAVHAHDCE
jgi:hypothetical protein